MEISIKIIIVGQGRQANVWKLKVLRNRLPVDLKEALWTFSWCTYDHEDCSKWTKKWKRYGVWKFLKLKILGLSLVAFGAQRMIVKFKLTHLFLSFRSLKMDKKEEDMACLKVWEFNAFFLKHLTWNVHFFLFLLCWLVAFRVQKVLYTSIWCTHSQEDHVKKQEMKNIWINV